MKYEDLTNEQRLELKLRILTGRYEARGESASYSELADAGSLVSDEDAESYAKGIEFSPDDFSRGEAADRDGVLDELTEWVERELTDRNFAKSKHRLGSIRWDEHCGIEWAKHFLLAHIGAVR